jgi:predicted pyridoxine 5'-phosphate oxidase superfamily flavin-nucleotide-binding protein
MVDLPEEAVEMFNNEDCDKSRPLVWISTVGVRDKEGDPHLAPVCFTKVLDTNKILVAINFATQTMYNIETYSRVAVGIAVHYDGFLAKGTGAIIEKGSEFEQVEEMVKARFGDKIKPKAALLIYVEEVYSLKPDSGSKKIV